MSHSFDIVIPVGPCDLDMLNCMIQSTKKNVLGYRNIYLVSYDPNIQVDSCITVSETIFPFQKTTIAQYLGENERNGWYLQQLLKLYAGFVIKDILNDYLVIDLDTIFVRKTKFFNEEGMPLYNFGTENHMEYFRHMARMDSSLFRKAPYSGICHHMMFQKHILEEMFARIESQHKEPFFQTFLKCVDSKHILYSGASEYELYFQYLHIYHADKFRIRQLTWVDNAQIIDENMDYVCYHYYNRSAWKEGIASKFIQGQC